MIPRESTWVFFFGENLNLARLPIPPRGHANTTAARSV